VRSAVIGLTVVLLFPRLAPAQTTTAWYLRNTTRVESWDFFHPHPGGGDPTNTFIGNRLLAGWKRVAPRLDVQAAVQYVQLGWLPEDAVGPGPLGLGAVYYTHAEERHPGELYLKYLHVASKTWCPGYRCRPAASVIPRGQSPSASRRSTR
jgi:hypothetical protein